MRCAYCDGVMPASYGIQPAVEQWPWKLDEEDFCSRRCMLWYRYHTEGREIMKAVKKKYPQSGGVWKDVFEITCHNEELMKPRSSDPMNKPMPWEDEG